MRENDNPYLSKIILVGNKKDLSEGREVTPEEGKKKVEDLHLDDFLEISVKSSDDVDLLSGILIPDFLGILMLFFIWYNLP